MKIFIGAAATIIVYTLAQPHSAQAVECDCSTFDTKRSCKVSINIRNRQLTISANPVCTRVYWYIEGDQQPYDATISNGPETLNYEGAIANPRLSQKPECRPCKIKGANDQSKNTRTDPTLLRIMQEARSKAETDTDFQNRIEKGAQNSLRRAAQDQAAHEAEMARIRRNGEEWRRSAGGTASTSEPDAFFGAFFGAIGGAGGVTRGSTNGGRSRASNPVGSSAVSPGARAAGPARQQCSFAGCATR